MNDVPLRTLLLAVLAFGAVGIAYGHPTYGLFSDVETDSGTLAAADSFDGQSGGPTADAGGPYTVLEGASITLDGSESTANRGTIDSYDWRIVESAGDDSLSPQMGQQVSYNAPSEVSSETTAKVELTVTNNGQTDTDVVTITVTEAGCGSSSLTFCRLTLTDEDSQYKVGYEVGDPDGEYDRVEVTLYEEQNQQNKHVETVTSSETVDTLTVQPTGRMMGSYTVRIELYNTTGAVDECQIAREDASDGRDPSLSPC